MNEIMKVCRLCPTTVQEPALLNVFEKSLSLTHTLKDVILVTAGVEILEHDFVSTKICQRCYNITLRMFQFRQDALKQDRALKEQYNRYLQNKGGIKLPNSCITIKKENRGTPLSCKVITTVPACEPPVPLVNKEDLKKRLHSTVANIYKNFPHLKLPKKCFDQHMAPVVSLPLGEVECYFEDRKLNMNKFIYKPSKSEPVRKIAKKKTTYPTKQKIIAPLKISKTLFGNNEQPETDNNNYVCTPAVKKRRGRKKKISSEDVPQSEPTNQNIELVSQSTTKLVPERFGNNKQLEGGNNNDVVTEVPKKKRGRKRKIPLGDTLQSETTNKNGELVGQSVTKSVTETPEPARKKPNIIKSSLPAEELPNPAPKKTEPTKASTPAQIDSNPENNRESSSTNTFETTTTNNTDKPEFDSLGLTPRVFTTKSQTLVVCNLCGSVHNNAFELKRHIRKHMICQFCKQVFKSLETKENHVENSCQVKEIMNSSEPIVALEKTHLNLDVRRKYMDAFSTFDPIPGLVEPAPLEHVLLEAPSPPAADGVIILSDDEEFSSRDPFSGISAPSENMPAPAVENHLYNTISSIKAEVKIKNNTILNNIAPDLTDAELLKDLIALVRRQTPPCEEILQTDLPSSEDIKINKSQGICKFNNLKEQLIVYSVPITINNGPFNVTYQFKKDSSSRLNRSMALWDDLPAIDGYKKSALPKTSTESEDNTVSHPIVCETVLVNLPSDTKLLKLLNLNSQISGPSVPAVRNVPAVLPPCTTTTASATLVSLPISRLSLINAESSRPIDSVVSNLVPQTMSNDAANPINTSATPHLQNCASSTTRTGAPEYPPLSIKVSSSPTTVANSHVARSSVTAAVPTTTVANTLAPCSTTTSATGSASLPNRLGLITTENTRPIDSVTSNSEPKTMNNSVTPRLQNDTSSKTPKSVPACPSLTTKLSTSPTNILNSYFTLTNAAGSSVPAELSIKPILGNLPQCSTPTLTVASAPLANVKSTHQLQNDASSMPPPSLLLNKTVIPPKTHGNMIVKKNGDVSCVRPSVSANEPNSSEHSLPANIAKVNTVVHAPSTSLASISVPKTDTNVDSPLPTANSSASTSGGESISTPITSNILRFRVRNVWELQ